MASESSQPDRATELQAAFQRHLPRRLGTLLRRARAECRSGWDCNVLVALHGELSLLADACERYGEPATGAGLRTLTLALAGPVAAHGIPDAAASGRIDALLDGLRPRIPAAPIEPAVPGGPRGDGSSADPFAHCEAPPDGYWRQLGIPDSGEPLAVPPAIEVAATAPSPAKTRGPRVGILSDDDPVVTELMLRLEGLGCEVTLAERLDDLVAQLREAPPALVVLVADPGAALAPLAVALERARRRPDPPVRLLVLLRTADAALRLAALRAGADRCLALPASAEDVSAAARELIGAGREAPYRVLIVEDDPAQALFAQAILRHAGMATRTLAEALPVLDELDRFRPDLLLLDRNLPDCDGNHLAAMIRARPRHRDLAIMFLSGDQDGDRQSAALGAGGDDFLVKPVRPAHLVAAVTERVRRGRALAATRRQGDCSAAAVEAARHAELLDALLRHVATDAAAGGLLALAVCDAPALRARLGPAAFERALAEVEALVTDRLPPTCLIARHGPAGYLVLAPDRGEQELAALGREWMDAAHDARFGADAVALSLVGAACGIDRSAREPAAALSALAQALAVARGQPGRIVCHSRLPAHPPGLARQPRPTRAGPGPACPGMEG